MNELTIFTISIILKRDFHTGEKCVEFQVILSHFQQNLAVCTMILHLSCSNNTFFPRNLTADILSV